MNQIARHAFVSYLLIFSETGLIFTGLFLGGFASVGTESPTWIGQMLLPLVITVFLMLSMFTMRLYAPTQRETRIGVQLRVIFAFGLAAILAVLLVLPWYRGGWPFLNAQLQAGFFTWLLISLFRWRFPNPFLHRLMQHKVLILGAGIRARKLAGTLRREADRVSFELVGFVTPGTGSLVMVDDSEVIGTREGLLQLCRQHEIGEIVVALDDRRGAMPLESLLRCRMQGIAITDAANFLERNTGKIPVDWINPSTLIFSDGFRPYSRGNYLLERLFNMALALALLALCSPLLLLAVLCILLEDGWKHGVFYRQPRVGRSGKVFQILKFRSMRPTETGDHARWAEVDDPRITRVGKIIRKLHVDELPQIFNILKGEMNIVGPRPEQPAFVDRLQQQIPYYHERHLVNPGLTGWAQIRYPYGASEEDALEKLKYDLYYIKRRSLSFNLQIFLQTIEVVLFTRGAR